MNINEQVFNLVFYGDFDKLKALYDVQDIDLNMKNDAGDPLIVYATKEYRGEIVKWLADRGVDMNARDKEGKTALMWAAHENLSYIARSLLLRGAHPNLKDREGNTALMHYLLPRYNELKNAWTSKSKDLLEMIMLLYHFGADSMLKNDNGVCPNQIFRACPLYVEDICTPIISDRKIDTQLYYVIHNIVAQNEKAAAVLAETFENVDAVDRNGWTALQWASMSNYVKVIEKLKDRANLNYADSNGVTALMHAAQEWNVEAVKLLLLSGADANMTDNLGRTALMYACEENYDRPEELWRPTIEALLDGGADKDLEDLQGMTAYDYAQESGDASPALSSLEIYEPQNLSYQDPYVLHPNLIEAVSKDDTQSLQYHLVCGEEAYTVKKDGQVIQHMGKNPYYFDKEGKTLFDHAIENNSMRALEYLLYFGLNPNQQNKDGRTPIYKAYQYENQKAIHLLRYYHADESFVRQIDLKRMKEVKEDQTGDFLSLSLINAVLKEDKEALAMALDEGKDPNKFDQNGKTLFDIAIENNLLRGLFNLVSLGVDPNMKNKQGQTPLEKAYELKMPQAPELLITFGAEKQEPEKIASCHVHGRQNGHFGESYQHII